MLKEIIIDFQIPYPDPSIEVMTFFKQSSFAGPHFDLRDRLCVALEGLVEEVAMEIYACYCKEPVPSQRSDCRVLCDEKNVDSVIKIIQEVLTEDDHGLLNVFVEVGDEAETCVYAMKGEQQ